LEVLYQLTNRGQDMTLSNYLIALQEQVARVEHLHECGAIPYSDVMTAYRAQNTVLTYAGIVV